ncbi:hypothetical protein [Ktedonobacter robiniae]|uniref:Zinc-finger domain-containing protein n=1 Tax=Ktedonobacter robiniae TaxID=2778365 RepID=A0ABQ3UN50_9CHLR|nr:hypothetical protein [Ktedonobacter robiniae]GHO54133.1 hypothetical protein KSB_26080 [Ktedonobacter robiniae]
MMKNCSHIMAPEDDALLSLALDDVPLSTEAACHLAGCVQCRERLERYRQTNNFLLNSLYRSQCPDATTLNLFCAHYLSPDEVMTISEHLAFCPLCAQDVREIRRVLQSFEAFPNESSQPLSVLRRAAERIVATLVPWQPQLVTRGEVAETPWPRQYRAGTLNISLHLSRASNGDLMMLGLFSCADPDESIEAFEGVDAHLYPILNHLQEPGDVQPEIMLSTSWEKEPPLISTKIDDLGNIVFKPVPVGNYTLVVQLPENEVVIEGLKIERS